MCGVACVCGYARMCQDVSLTLQSLKVAGSSARDAQKKKRKKTTLATWPLYQPANSYCVKIHA